MPNKTFLTEIFKQLCTSLSEILSLKIERLMNEVRVKNFGRA